MKVLNLYAGIGGNRKLWTDVEVTAVEYCPWIAEIYKKLYPQDELIVGDAHEYLLVNFDKFDFIWASPPCPTHSRFNLIQVAQGMKPRYPEMTLYQEIVLLKHWFKGKFCVENVITYYEPLIKPTESNNHYFWTNFHFSPFKNTTRHIRRQAHSERAERVDFNLSEFNLSKVNEKKVLNNCVEPELGLHILNESKRNVYQELFS